MSNPSSMQLRKKTVANAEKSQELEGLEVSRTFRGAAENYVAGKINAKKVAKKIRERYNLKEK